METRSFLKQSRSSRGAAGTHADISASLGPLSNPFVFRKLEQRIRVAYAEYYKLKFSGVNVRGSAFENKG